MTEPTLTVYHDGSYPLCRMEKRNIAGLAAAAGSSSSMSPSRMRIPVPISCPVEP